MAQIKTEEAYNATLKRIEELEKLVDYNTLDNTPEYLELDMLCDLVEEYEAIHYPIGKPSLIDTIKLRMYELGLNQKAVAAMLGISAPRLSEIMNGKAEPSLSIAKALYQKLNISADVILG
ncbi:MAG: helix-turn-helix domain-containing protein [Alphaproteobacteria bacterium]|nr:helix-turn-helix domain-containing protein [Alphaproteobacteria bacterium]